MNIHFYNVPPHTGFYSATVAKLEEPNIVAAFITAINAQHRYLSINLDDDMKHGQIILRGKRIVALFSIE